MISPILALRAAIRFRCLPDRDLAELMDGEVRIHDEPPRGQKPVYATFDEVTARDWSDSGGRGHEQRLAIVVWAKPGSAATALKAADRMAWLLDDAPLLLAEHRLVSLAVTAAESARDRETQLTRVVLRLRAVTEIAP